MEFEEEDIQKYISNINKIIKSGSPKYITYISKEYLRNEKSNPYLAQVIEGLVNTEAKKAGSIYAILVDNDGTINLNAMSDLSKVSNVAELVKNIEALSGQNVDFGSLTSEELIVEGMQIAEDLAREVDSLESNIDFENENVDESIVTDIESKADDAVQIATKMGGTGGAILAIISVVRSKISSILSKIRTGKSKAKDDDNQAADNYLKAQKNQKENNTKPKDNKESKSWIPKVVTPVIKKAVENKEELENGKKGFNVDGTDDYDPSDDDVYDIDD